MPPDFQLLALDVEQEDAFLAGYLQIHLESTVQELLEELETSRTERGKAVHRVSYELVGERCFSCPEERVAAGLLDDLCFADGKAHRLLRGNDASAGCGTAHV